MPTLGSAIPAFRFRNPGKIPLPPSGRGGISIYYLYFALAAYHFTEEIYEHINSRIENDPYR